ncbi:MAG: hypothetical protein AAGI37_08870 [Planctomycetota bacterium]
MTSTGYSAFVMAMERVEKRLRMVSSALDAAGIAYAVVGGNAVAAWVSRVDPAATRATKDVGLLVRKDDDEEISRVMADLGFERQDLRPLVLFTDPEEPSKRSGVHLVWSDTLIRPSYACPSPSVDEAVRDPEGFAVLDLPALVRMKLTSFRDVDRVHVADLAQVGLIDQALIDSLPVELKQRLTELLDALESDDE